MKKLSLLAAGTLYACMLSAQPSFETSLQAGISLPLNSNNVNGTHAGTAIHFGNHLDYTFGSKAFRIGLGAYLGYINSIATDNKYKAIGESIAEKYRFNTDFLVFKSSSFKSAHVLLGPVASFVTEKININIWAKGGYGLNEPSRYAVQYKENGVNTMNIYINQEGDNKNGLAYNAGAAVKLSISDYVGLQFALAYFGTQTAQVNYNYDREKGTAPLYYTASNQFIQASAGLQFTIGKPAKKMTASRDNSIVADTISPVAASMNQRIKTKSNIKNDRMISPDNNDNDDPYSDSLFFQPQKIELRSKVSDFGMSRVQLQSVGNYLTGFLYQSGNRPVINQCGSSAMEGEPIPGIDVRLRRKNGAVMSADFNTARTNQDGSFSFNNLQPGNYTAEAANTSMDITVLGNRENIFKTLDVMGGSCGDTKQNYIVNAGDKTYVEVIPRDAASGIATGKKHLAGVKYEDFKTLAPRDAASGMATGKRMHKPMLVSNTDFDVDYNSIVTEDGRYYAEVSSSREAGSGMATGRRSMIVTGDVDGDGIEDNAVITPRDAASGMPTGKRMHKPIVITKELDKRNSLVTTPRDAASGLPTGKRMHKPFVITAELEDDDNDNAAEVREAGSGMATGRRQYQPIVVRIYPDEDSYEELVPRDAASGLPTGKRMHKPFVITKELGYTEDGQEITTYKIIHRDIAARNVLTERDVASGMPTGRRLNKKAEDAYTPWDNDADDGVVANPLYQGGGGSGSNPLYEPKSNLRIAGSNGKEHTVFLPNAITLQNNTAVAENNSYDVQPIKWMAPESLGGSGKSINEKGIKRSEAASKKGITEKGIKMNAEKMEANAERKGWDGTVKGGNVEESKVVVKGWDPEKKELIDMKETNRIRCSNGTCAVEGIVTVDGVDYEAIVYGVLKTRHETAKNSISNVR
ncbi:MAG: hypothetical protein QM726_25295 [Chitinophagaceae bacterium]